MKRHVLTFGLGGGIFMATLLYAEYRFVTIEHPVELFEHPVELFEHPVELYSALDPLSRAPAKLSPTRSVSVPANISDSAMRNLAGGLAGPALKGRSC